MREKEYLLKSYLTITNIFAVVSILMGLILFIPLLVIPFYPDEVKFAGLFLIPGLFSLILGLVLFFFTRKGERVPVVHPHTAVIVTIAWIYGSILGAVPFVLSGNYSWSHAIFESVSGWTTTGLSVVNVALSPKIILLWRSFMQYIGGAGFVLVLLSIFNVSSGSGVFQAEGHNEEIYPHVKQAARIILKVYLTFLLVGTTAYVLAGMTHFDAINHAMAGLSTGGFSTQVDSIGHYNSIMIEIITIFLMLIGQTSFSVNNQILLNNWKAVFNNIEIKTTIVVLTLAIVLTLLFVTGPIYIKSSPDFSQILSKQQYYSDLAFAVRKTVFECTSALTTTGFGTINYKSWGLLGGFFLTILMLLGGQTNSTAGGIKMLRVYLIYKIMSWMFLDLFLPESAVKPHFISKMDKKIYIGKKDLINLISFITIYLILLCIGTSILTYSGYGFLDSLFEYASVISNSGLSYGITSYQCSPLVLNTMTIGMLLGRLEFILIFYGLARFIKDISFIVHSSLNGGK